MNIDYLQETELFSGIAKDDIAKLLACTEAYEKSYARSELVYEAGQHISHMGLVLCGSVDISFMDIWGNRRLVSRAEKGQIFAETYSSIKGEPLGVNVFAQADSRILFINASRLLSTCASSCPCHSVLLCNLIDLCLHNNLALSRRILHASFRTIRARLMSYLSEQAVKSGSLTFDIPFDRQQMADYLGVERSALCAELSKMRAEGLINCKKRKFTLYGKEYGRELS